MQDVADLFRQPPPSIAVVLLVKLHIHCAHATHFACSSADGRVSNCALNLSCHFCFSSSVSRPMQFATAVFRPPMLSIFFPNLLISAATTSPFSFAQKFPHVFPCLCLAFMPCVPVDMVRLLLSQVCILCFLYVSDCLHWSTCTYPMPQDRLLLRGKIECCCKLSPNFLL